MLKTLLLTLLTLGTLAQTHAQGHNFELRFWDGTFAYNQLIVKSNPHQNNIMTMELSGSQINLGSQLEGLPQMWSARDRMVFSMPKDKCETLDIENKAVRCQADRLFVGNLTWQISQRFTKTYSGIVENLTVVANQGIASVTFKVPADEDFTPHQETVSVHFFTNFF